ncbi:hypothetical protein [Streptomyces sp. NPDC006134]|uniref:hypothetical protein n=1 Tax=Streptomyces sp. NPDC006134 TaxID=3154467 RepID=UPI003410D0AB
MGSAAWLTFSLVVGPLALGEVPVGGEAPRGGIGCRVGADADVVEVDVAPAAGGLVHDGDAQLFAEVSAGVPGDAAVRLVVGPGGLVQDGPVEGGQGGVEVVLVAAAGDQCADHAGTGQGERLGRHGPGGGVAAPGESPQVVGALLVEAAAPAPARVVGDGPVEAVPVVVQPLRSPDSKPGFDRLVPAAPAVCVVSGDVRPRHIASANSSRIRLLLAVELDGARVRIRTSLGVGSV